MSQPNFELIRKTWENLEDDVIIKDVSTKGKNISECITFLSERNEWSNEEATKYFEQKVNTYVYRLLTNRQLFKADHILNNIGQNSKFVLYEIALGASDTSLKDYILHNLKSKLVDGEEEVLHANWKSFKFYKENARQVIDMLDNDGGEESDLEIETMSFNTYCDKKSNCYRNSVAVNLFFRNRETIVAPVLDKYTSWNYLVKNTIDNLIKIWIEINYLVKWRPKIELDELKFDVYDDDVFNETLKKLFSKWEVDDEMVKTLSRNKILSKNEILLNKLAKYGKFVLHESMDSIQILKRLFTTETFFQNRQIIKTNTFRKDFTNFIAYNNIFQLLSHSLVDLKQLKVLVQSEDCEQKREIDLFLSMKDLFNRSNTTTDILRISKSTSGYLQHYNDQFYEENAFVKLFEYILEGKFPTKDTLWLPKIPHLYNFVNRSNEAVELNVLKLLKIKSNIDLNAIREGLFDDFETEDDLVVPHFSHKSLCAKYSNQVNFKYIHHIKHYRCAYAAYLFFVEQLKDYSKITQGQILTAARGAAELAFDNYKNEKLVVHCIAFIEMIGVETYKIRAYLKCLNSIHPNVKLENFENDKLVKILDENHETLEAATIFCQTNGLLFPEKRLNVLAENNDWFKFTLHAQYLDYPVDQVVDMCQKSFADKILGLNLMKAIKYYKNVVQEKVRSGSMSMKERRNRSDSISAPANFTGIIDASKFLNPKYDIDLYATILLCSNEVNSHLVKHKTILNYKKFIELFNGLAKNENFNNQTHLNLLKMSLKMKWPILSMFSAMICYENVVYCWLTWLLMSTDYNFDEKIVDRFENVEVFAKDVVKYCISDGFVRTLGNSLMVFYPESHFSLFTRYLTDTINHNFGPETTNLLKDFVQQLHDNDKKLIIFKDKNEVIDFCVKLLIIHLKNNFKDNSKQQNMLKSLNESEISYFTTLINFGRLSEIMKIIEFTEIELNFEALLSNEQKMYEEICEKLLELKYFKKAVELAEIMKIPKDNIIYESWIFDFDSKNDITYKKYEEDLINYDLPADLLLNFYIHVAKKLDYVDKHKYLLLKKGLDLIKKHKLYPSETFDRDKLEYEMILSYLKCQEHNLNSTEVYHSDYFEKTVRNERGILFNTFLEMKEIAGIDELTISNLKLKTKEHILKLDELINKLLRDGDMIQALRYQMIFDERPADLHFLVFCMALAENLVTLYDLPKEERQMLNEDMKRAGSRFNRRTLRSSRRSQTSTSSSPSRIVPMDTSSDINSSVVFEFEEIPSRERQDILEAIQGLASRINNGVEIAQRIVLIYRASIYLDKEYNEIIKIKEYKGLFDEAIENDCFNKLLVFSDIMSSFKMSPEEVAEFMSSQIVSAIIKSRFYIFSNQNQISPSKIEDNLWGYNLDMEFHLFLELCPNTTALGNSLLKYCDTLKYYKKLDKSSVSKSAEQQDVDVKLLNRLKIILRNQVLSLKKQNTIIVALLVKAHECFVHECSMEGIVNVLQRSKALNNVLANAKSWSLIVKLLTGIGRYRDMYYCFETLIKNDQFESLLGQFDEKRTSALKTAIISYLHEHCPENIEHFRLASVHFLMYKELAEMWENEAKSTIAKLLADHEYTDKSNLPKLKLKRLKCTNLAISQLKSAMDGFSHATENYLMDDKLNLAQKGATNAEILALQLNLAKMALEKVGLSEEDKTCISILSIFSNRDAIKHHINHDLNVPQALILARSYNYEINWTEAIFIHFVLNGEDSFLTDYLNRMPISDHIIESLVKNFQLETNITKKMEASISKLIDMLSTATLKYKLASLLGLKKIVNELINSPALYYLRDTDYGRSEVLL